MYLQKLLMINSGVVQKLQLDMSFKNDGTPKPTILVGTNGSGKTSALSTVADALIELASSKFQDIAPTSNSSRSFFKILGTKTVTVSAAFELLAASFKDQSESFYYIAHNGDPDPAIIGDALEDYEPYRNFVQNPPAGTKAISGDPKKIEIIFHAGSYAFFPSSRFESPYWANYQFLERDPDADFTPSYQNKLGKPIILQSSIQSLKSWMVDIMLDASVDVATVFSASDLDTLKQAS